MASISEKIGASTTEKHKDFYEFLKGSMYFESSLVPLKEKDQLDIAALTQYLQTHVPGIGAIKEIGRFTGGYSNLTYCLQTSRQAYVLRKPPIGANIKSAHDMGREFRVLSFVKPLYPKVPKPIIYCESSDIIGAPFYIMEKMEGLILRAANAPKLHLPADTYAKLSESLVDNLVELHALDIQANNLIELGKPEGYVQRQTAGWIKRYYAAETDTIESMNVVAKWMGQHFPKKQAPALLHNDYKYDNLILNTNDLTQIVGVLDWEMATVGDPLMDLGATLAYWFEAGEDEVFKMYNLSWLPGNYTRKEIIARYANKSGRDLTDINFYYVFGLFKNAVIAQQIYHRWKQGFSTDARFGALLPMIQLLAKKAVQATKTP